jgi:hypothetical protein
MLDNYFHLFQFLVFVSNLELLPLFWEGEMRYDYLVDPLGEKLGIFAV